MIHKSQLKVYPHITLRASSENTKKSVFLGSSQRQCDSDTDKFCLIQLFCFVLIVDAIITVISCYISAKME